jgi:hypothetical protein
MSTDNNVCDISTDYYTYSNQVILSHGNGVEDWIFSTITTYNPANYRRELGLAELHENCKHFEEPTGYIKINEPCPNRCFEYCSWLTEDDILPQSNPWLPRLQRKCAGFWFHGNSTDYHCYFAIGTEQYPPRSAKKLTKKLAEDWNLVSVSTPIPSDIKIASFFKINPLLPPPPHPPGYTMPFPSSPPIFSPPPPSIENLILRPEILIPLITGSVMFLILFIYVFRLCTKERADAFNRVFRTITRRKSNRVVVNTNKKVELRRAIRK